MNENDIKFIEKAIEVRNKGWYVNSKELTDVYNRVLNKKRAQTSCGSCLRAMVNELEAALKAFKAQNKAVETPPETLIVTIPTEENKSILDDTGTQNKPIKKAGRTKKK